MPLPQSDHQAIRKHGEEYAPFHPSGEFAPVPVSASGVRIRRAIVVGPIDVSDCTAAGGGCLPALSLEHCRLLGRTDGKEAHIQDDEALVCLDLSRASLTSLSLRHSAFTHVAVLNARVEGAVDISGVQPLDSWEAHHLDFRRMVAFREAMTTAADNLRSGRDARAFEDLPPVAGGGYAGTASPPVMASQHYCWLDLSGSRIQGSILARGVRLRAPRRDREGLANVRRRPRFALRLEATVVAGTLDARGSSVFDGGLSLYLAEIRDEVWLGGGCLLKEEGIALDGQGARLGSLFAIAPPLRTLGTIFLNSATISGHLNFQAADLDGDGSSSLLAESATIGGDVTLGGGVAARGPVGLAGTRIGGALDFRGAVLSGVSGASGRAGTPLERCDAIHGSNLSVGSDAFLSDGFIAYGCVSLSGARIGDSFDLRGATLAGSVPNPFQSSLAAPQAAFAPTETSISALSCSDMHVGGTVRLGSSRPPARLLVAQGRVTLQRASVGTDLDIINARIARSPSAPAHARVLDLGWITVAGTLILDSNQFDGAVNLEHASTNVLCDDEGGYGGASSLHLNGLKYEAFYEPQSDQEAPDARPLVETRKAWLQKLPRYRPQPYANLARVLIRHGRPDEARDILVEKYRQERKERLRELHLALLVRRPFDFACTSLFSLASWLWGFLFGYGLKPSRAIVTLLCAFAVGGAFFFVANLRRAMVIDQQPMAGYVQGDQMGAVRATGEFASSVWCNTSIDPVLYALDVFIPLVDLRQESKCEMGRASDAPRFFEGFNIRGTTVLSELSVYRHLKAFYALSGWLLISLSILTFSGVLQQRDADE